MYYSISIGTGFSGVDYDDFDIEAGVLQGLEGAPLGKNYNYWDIILTNKNTAGKIGCFIDSFNETYSSEYPDVEKYRIA